MNTKNVIQRLTDARRIGIVRTDRLGDMVLTLPLAAALKQRFAAASVEMIARSYVSPLLENCPVLDAVHYSDRQPLKDIYNSAQFDVVFFPRPVFSELVESVRSSVPVRVGSAYRWYSALCNAKIHDHRKVARFHEAEYNVRMLSTILNEEIPTRLVPPFISTQSLKEAQSILRANGIEATDECIIIHPASGGSAQEWSPENFARAAASVLTKLPSHQKLRVIVTGTEAEREKCDRVCAAHSSAVNVCGQLSLAVLMAVVKQCRLLLANSTGVLHIAAAIGTPVVGIFPRSPHVGPVRWGPYTKLSRVITPRESQPDDLQYVSVESVSQAALELLLV